MPPEDVVRLRHMVDALERPDTDIVGVEKAMATLDYREMMALAGLLEDWAFNEPDIEGDRRTRLLQMSVDYERIAAFCGEGWKAEEPNEPPEMMAFIARKALASSRESGAGGQG